MQLQASRKHSDRNQLFRVSNISTLFFQGRIIAFETTLKQPDRQILERGHLQAVVLFSHKTFLYFHFRQFRHCHSQKQDFQA